MRAIFTLKPYFDGSCTSWVHLDAKETEKSGVWDGVRLLCLTSVLSTLHQVSVRNSSLPDNLIVFARLLFRDAFISFNQEKELGRQNVRAEIQWGSCALLRQSLPIWNAGAQILREHVNVSVFSPEMLWSRFWMHWSVSVSQNRRIPFLGIWL